MPDAKDSSQTLAVNTHRVSNLQALTLSLIGVGQAILAGGSEEEIQILRLIPDRQLHFRPNTLNRKRK